MKNNQIENNLKKIKEEEYQALQESTKHNQEQLTELKDLIEKLKSTITEKE